MSADVGLAMQFFQTMLRAGSRLGPGLPFEFWDRRIGIAVNADVGWIDEAAELGHGADMF